MASIAVNQLQIAPLGAGDLIDRTVRLYRRHFMALIRASAPPVFIGAAGAVLYTVCVRSIAATDSGERLLLYLLLSLFGIFVRFLSLLAQLIVLGGASRNLVMHLLWDEPVTARLIYRSVRSRFWALVWASLAMMLWIVISAGAALAAWLFVMFFVLFGIGVLGQVWPDWVVGVLALAFSVLSGFGAFLLFFLIVGSAAYVPQALMVEGRGVLDAVGRSAGLARGNMRRLMAMFLFTLVASYSALSLLIVPLGWVAYLNGVNPFDLDAARMPVWYSIGTEVALQMSTILLAPVWTMGLSLLYVDERVRHEGYDIELLAAQRLGEIPQLPAGKSAPLAPALAAPQARPPSPPPDAQAKPPGSVLGIS